MSHIGLCPVDPTTVNDENPKATPGGLYTYLHAFSLRSRRWFGADAVPEAPHVPVVQQAQ